MASNHAWFFSPNKFDFFSFEAPFLALKVGCIEMEIVLELVKAWLATCVNFCIVFNFMEIAGVSFPFLALI